MKDALAGVGMPLGEGGCQRRLKSWKTSENQFKKTILTQGYYQKIIPLPRLKGRIPTMAADLRSLVFIPIEQIGLSGTEYVRIASLEARSANWCRGPTCRLPAARDCLIETAIRGVTKSLPCARIEPTVRRHESTRFFLWSRWVDPRAH